MKKQVGLTEEKYQLFQADQAIPTALTVHIQKQFGISSGAGKQPSLASQPLARLQSSALLPYGSYGLVEPSLVGWSQADQRQ